MLVRIYALEIGPPKIYTLYIVKEFSSDSQVWDHNRFRFIP